jgi:hypothetical protein
MRPLNVIQLREVVIDALSLGHRHMVRVPRPGGHTRQCCEGASPKDSTDQSLIDDGYRVGIVLTA